MAARTLAQLRWLVRGELRERGIFTDAKAGTVSVASTTATTVTGSGTAFTEEYQVGDEMKIAGVIRTITGIASDTSLTVNKAFGAISASVAHYLVQRQGGWTDEDVDNALEDSRLTLQNRLWREAPRALYGSAVANTVAGADTVTLPTGMLAFEQVQYRGNTTEGYQPLRHIDVTLKNAGAAYPWWLINGSGGTPDKPTGRPVAYTVINATTLELDTYPDVSTTNGLRFYGTQEIAALAADTDTIGLPEPEMWERVLVLWASTSLLSQSETDVLLARGCAAQGAAAYQAAVAPWQAGGREMGAESIVAVE